MTEIVHFAISTSAACGQHIHGSTVRISNPEIKNNPYSYSDYDGGANIQHTSDPEKVTCSNCLRTKVYKEYVAGVV